MKKKLICIVLISTYMFTLTACGKDTTVSEDDTAISANTLDSEDKEDTSNTENTTITGTIKTFTGSQLTLTTTDKKELKFDTSSSTLECKNGMATGNEITVIYTGSISNTDTSKAKVTKIINTNDNSDVTEKMVTLPPTELDPTDFPGGDKADDKKKEEEKKAKEEEEKKAAETEKEKVPTDTQITDVNETVYAVSPVNIRDAANKTANVMGFINGGEAIQRTGICANGWSRVSYKGSEGYVWGTYLTTTAPSSTPAETPTPEAPAQASVSGTVISASGSSLTIALEDNSQMNFALNGASINCAEGLIVGNQVDVTYDSSQKDGPAIAAISISDSQ